MLSEEPRLYSVVCFVCRFHGMSLSRSLAGHCTHTHTLLPFLLERAELFSCYCCRVEILFYSTSTSNKCFIFLLLLLLACLLSILVHIHTSNIERIPKYLFFFLILLLLLHVDEKTIEQEEMKNKNKKKNIER